jgi:hypothetical protein
LTKEGSQKSLKDQNRWQLWLTIAANAVVFYAVAQSEVFATSGLKGLVTEATNLLPVSLALVITSVANGLLPANMKARLVFLRWKHALPGHRAFSKHAKSDPRIDVDRLKKSLGNKFPTDPEGENRAWYRIFKEVEADPAVQHIHREFLFTRDYASLAILFFIAYGMASVFLVPSWKVSLVYCLLLLLQFVVVRQAAATYGTRFVCTVLARKAASLSPRKAAVLR